MKFIQLLSVAVCAAALVATGLRARKQRGGGGATSTAGSHASGQIALVAAQQPDTQVAVPLDWWKPRRAQTVELRPVAAGETRQAEAPAAGSGGNSSAGGGGMTAARVHLWRGLIDQRRADSKGSGGSTSAGGSTYIAARPARADRPALAARTVAPLALPPAGLNGSGGNSSTGSGGTAGKAVLSAARAAAKGSGGSARGAAIGQWWIH